MGHELRDCAVRRYQKKLWLQPGLVLVLWRKGVHIARYGRSSGSKESGASRLHVMESEGATAFLFHIARLGRSKGVAGRGSCGFLMRRDWYHVLFHNFLVYNFIIDYISGNRYIFTRPDGISIPLIS